MEQTYITATNPADLCALAASKMYNEGWMALGGPISDPTRGGYIQFFNRVPLAKKAFEAATKEANHEDRLAQMKRAADIGEPALVATAKYNNQPTEYAEHEYYKMDYRTLERTPGGLKFLYNLAKKQPDTFLAKYEAQYGVKPW